MDRIKEFLKSILAGIMISIGGTVFLSCDNKIVGSVLFSVGLISIVMLGFNLYTGRIGYIFKNDKIFAIDTLLSIVGNLVGCLLLGLAKPPINNVVKMCSSKLDKSLFATFIDAVFCGILIYVCVEIYKKYNNIIGIIFCIPTFILCGFEHSVADMFYFINARSFSVKSLLFIITVIIGNGLGGLLIPLLMKTKKA